MKKTFPKILASILILFLSACAGTGTKDISSISFKKSPDKANLFFIRKNVYLASAGLIKVLVNGVEVGKIGVGEMEKFQTAPGSTSIKASTGNLAALGATGDTYAFKAEAGKNYYFILTYDQKFFSGGWKINETTERGFKSAVE